MSLQFVLGNSGSGKSHFLFTNIIAAAEQNPNKTYLVIVPEQFTMQTQKELVRLSPQHALMNIDIVSFQRLALRVFAEVGGEQHPVLEEVGKTLVIQRIIQENASKLGVLSGSLRKRGTIAEMKSLVSEFMQYDIRPEQIDEMIEKSKEQPLLVHKLYDIQRIYEGFLHYLENRYITSEEILDVLCEKITESRMMKNCEVVLDGFTGFTPVQNKLMRKILVLAERVWVTITLDEKSGREKWKSPQHLFHMSGMMMERLLTLAREEHVSMDEEIWIRAGRHSRLAGAPALAFLEQNLFRYKTAQENTDNIEEIQIFAANNPRREVEIIVNEIQKLVRTKAYRYGDFAIITGDLSVYGTYARQVFEEGHIPYFIDEKHSIMMNPFVEYLRAALNMAAEHFSYESVFRYLRCGLSKLSLFEIDSLENYCIALGIRGMNKWQQKWVRQYRGMAEGSIVFIDEMRQKFLDEVQTFAERISQHGLSVEERTRILYDFICQGEIQQKLKQKEDFFAEQGEMALVKEYAQIYEIIMQLLDKIVQVLGTEKISLVDYIQILEAGFQELQVGIIPPTADQVLVGDMERTRLKDIKILFFAGVNDHVIPKRSGNGGLLSESDREFLEEREVELAPTARASMYIQKFYLYLNLTKPSQRLYLSYAKTSGQGSEQGPAYLIPMLCRMFPKLKVKDIQEQSLEEAQLPYQASRMLLDACSLSELGEWLASREAPPSVSPTAAELVSSMAVAAESEPSSDASELLTSEPSSDASELLTSEPSSDESALLRNLELYQWFAHSPDWHSATDQWLRSAFLQKPSDKIGKNVAQALYGTELTNSVSRLEQFARCAFGHFLQYGLGLSERQLYEFKQVDLGTVIHEALEEFAKNLRKNKLSWRDLSTEDREKLIDESVEAMIHNYGNTILDSSKRNAYMIVRVKRILRRTVWAIQEQIKLGKYEPGKFEVSFAMEEKLEAIQFALSDKEQMRLNGRIDRVDRYETDDTIYVKVIDYKTGNTSMDLVALYHGLQLQLVVYMNAALEVEQREHPEKHVEPAGMFYYRVQDPLAEASLEDTQESVAQQLLKKLRVDGLVREERKIIMDMDETLEPKKESLVIPVKINQDGKLAANSRTASREQFAILSKYVKNKIKKTGCEILDGVVAVNPYQMKKNTACDYCAYKEICGFDTKIPGYEFRNLPSFEKDEIWKKLEQEDT